MSLKLQFLGAAQVVTGSKYLLENETGKILIDCGLFQGIKSLRLKNWEDFPLDASEINAIILTHAHIDHSGYIPKLVKEGFKGQIYCSPGTKDLAEILLKDSAKLKEEDAGYANKKKYSKHKPAKPLYTTEDVEKSLPLFHTIDFNQDFTINSLKCKFIRAGHILGAASLYVENAEHSIIFSGDIGRYDDLLMHPPNNPPESTHIVIESTYGNKHHPEEDPIEAIKPYVQEVLESEAVLMIPAFAVGRSQTLLLCLHKLFKRYPELKMPCYLNSPMASEVTELYQEYCNEHKLNEDQCYQVCSEAEFVISPEDSKKLNEKNGPMIIIAGSGMITGGRILHHLNKFAKEEKHILLLVGYQAEGTRGADLLEGANALKFFGYYHPINCKVANLESLSSHADQDGLLRWLKPYEKKTRTVFICHGETRQADALRRRIEERYSYEVIIPKEADIYKF